MVEKADTPSSAPDFVTNPELEEEIKIGRTTTFTITESYLRYYLEAAKLTNFEVTVIATQGKHYITEEIKPIHPRLRKNGQSPTISAIKSRLPVRPGSVAIALKRPEGVANDMAFHTARQKIQLA